MLNFIICDDTDAQSIREKVEPIIQELELGEIAMAENNPNKVFEYIEANKSPSVYFLDIELNTSINGIDVARLIREKDESSYIIFITAYEKFAFLTYKYKLRVMDYIVKPIKQESIRECLQAIHESEKNKKSMEYKIHKKNYILDIKSGWKQYRIDIRDIIYLEVIKNKIIIYTETGQISFFSTLKDIRDKLSSMRADSIIACHKSYLVNIKKIKQIDSMDLIMSNGHRCPLSRNYKRGITDAFGS